MCRFPAETAFPSDVSEKTDSDSTVVTVISGKCNSFDAQSLFSVDQDGFFTSMHADSGLAVQPVNLSTSQDVDSSSSINFDSSRNTSSEAKSFDEQSPAASSVSVTALTMQLSSSSFALTPTHSKLDAGDKTGTGQKASKSYIEKYRTAFQSPLSVQSVAGGFPSFCTVTPPSSDDEDEATAAAAAAVAVIDEFDSCNQYKTCNVISPSATVSTPLAPDIVTTERDMSSDVSLLNYYTLPKTTNVQSAAEADANGRYSTWPCSPVPGSGSSTRGILKSKSYGTKCQPQKFIKFSPVVSPGQEVSYNCNSLAVNTDSYSEEKSSSSAWSASRTLDQNQERDVEGSKSVSLSESVSQSDESTILGEQTLSEGAVLSKDEAGRVSAVGSSAASGLPASDAGVTAALVISSPVVLKSTYVENKHRRLICRPVRPDEWHKFTSYNSKNHWNSTLPRNAAVVSRTLNRCASERHHKRANTEGLNLRRRQQDGVVHDTQLSDSTVSAAQQNNASVPLVMFRSPRRYGIDGYCAEDSLQSKSSLSVEHAGDSSLVDFRKVTMKTAVVKPACTLLPQNVSETRIRATGGEMQLTTSSRGTLKPTNNVLQVPTFEGREQKPALRLMPAGICKHKNAPCSSDGNHLPCQLSACQHRSSVKSDVLQLPAADFETADSTCMSVDLDHTVNADACASMTNDAQTADGDGMKMFDCSQPDLLRINSAAVYNVSDARGSIARSSDSISSTLSAAERSRAAKLAFLGFSVGEDDQPLPVVNAANISQNTCLCPERSDDTCSSSGLGSSVSSSPVVSPDDNTSSDVDQTSSQPKHASCTALVSSSDKQLLDCTAAYRRTVSLIDRSRQTPI